MSDLYHTTLLNSKVPGVPQLCISTCVLEMATGRRYLDATLRIAVQSPDNGIRTDLVLPLDPGTMRAMARVLTEHATRAVDELMPLVRQAQPDPECPPAYGQEYA